MKICSKCEAEKPINFFYKNKRYRGGHCAQCIECKKDTDKNQYQKNKEKRKLKNRENYHKNKEFYNKRNKRNRKNRIALRLRDPKKALLNYMKRNAQARNLEFNLTINDIIIPEKCPILGIPPFFSKERQIDNTPSGDRVDNTKGYIKGNVRIISWRANSMKRDLTIEIAEQMVKYMKGEI